MLNSNKKLIIASLLIGVSFSVRAMQQSFKGGLLVSGYGTFLMGASALAVDRSIYLNRLSQDNWNSILINSCRNNDLVAMQEALRDGADPNVSGHFGSPLHIVCEKGNVDAVDLLLKFGVDIHNKPTWYMNAAYGSVRSVKIAERLLNHTTGTDQIKLATGLLFKASDDGRADLLRCAIDHGACVDKKNSDDLRTALHYACDDRNLETTQLLLEAGADANARDKDGKTPLHMACTTMRDRNVFSSINKRNPNLNLIKALHNAGANLDEKDNYGATPLLTAVQDLVEHEGSAITVYGRPQQHERRRIVDFLLQNGAAIDLDNKNPKGDSLLSVACDLEDPSLLGLFLKDAKPKHFNASNTKGLTPLHKVCRNSNRTLFNLFLAANKEHKNTIIVDAKDEDGLTPLHYVCSNGFIDRFEQLLAMGADPHIVAPKTNDWTSSYRRNFCRTPLQLASYHGHYEMVKQLVDMGVDVSVLSDPYPGDGCLTARKIAEERSKYAKKQAAENYKRIILLLNQIENSNPETVE